MNDDFDDFAHRLLQLRHRAGLNQEQLGEKIGVKRAAVYLWETRQGNPNSNNLKKLADAFDVDPYWLKTGMTSQPTLTMGQRIKQKRVERNLYQIDLARALNVKAASISQWESDENKPSGKNFYKLCEYLRVDADYLQAGIADDKPDPLSGLSLDALDIINLVSKLDRKDRRRVKAMKVLLGL